MRTRNSLALLLFALRVRPRPGLAAQAIPAAPEQRALRHEPMVDPECAHVPRVVFQTWKSRTEIPSNFRFWSESFPRHNPDYDCVLWDDADNREFIATTFPWFLPYYDGYPKEIFRADAVRFFFLYKFGGLYADMDAECLRPLDPVLRQGDAIFGRMGLDNSFEHSIPNAMMAARPRHAIWLLAISMLIERFSQWTPEEMARRGPERITGPVLLKEAVDAYRRMPTAEMQARTAEVTAIVTTAGLAPMLTANVRILEPEQWYPVDWANPFHQVFRESLMKNRTVLDHAQSARLFPRSSLVTYWTHSW